ASGARIQLPQSFQQSLLARNELSSLMNAYQNRTDIRSQEGAVGIFSNGEVDRSQLFIHVVRLLKGQMHYWYFGLFFLRMLAFLSILPSGRNLSGNTSN